MPIHGTGIPSYPRYGANKDFTLFHQDYLRSSQAGPYSTMRHVDVSRDALVKGSKFRPGGSSEKQLFRLFCSPKKALLCTPSLLRVAKKVQTVQHGSPADVVHWSAAIAPRVREAQRNALEQCLDLAKSCRVRLEDVTLD
jgi:hypothetical protein